jgi:hypothetical protein
MDLEKMSSHEIISYVRKQTGKRITISPKSKKSIIKKARELLGESIAKKLLGANKKVTSPKKSINEHVLEHYPSYGSEKEDIKQYSNIKDLLKLL